MGGQGAGVQVGEVWGQGAVGVRGCGGAGGWCTGR